MSVRPDYRDGRDDGFDRSGREWTIPPQAAQWLGAGMDSIESGRLRPAAERALQLHQWFERARRRLATVAIVAVSAFMLWHVIYGANGAMVFQQKRATVKKLQTDLVTLQAENEAYRRRVEQLKSDRQTIEIEARKFGLVKPGEVVFQQPNQQPPAPPANITARKE